MLEINEVRKMTNEARMKLIEEEELEIDRKIRIAANLGKYETIIDEHIYDENVKKYKKAGYKVSKFSGLYLNTTTIRW